MLLMSVLLICFHLVAKLKGVWIPIEELCIEARRGFIFGFKRRKTLAHCSHGLLYRRLLHQRQTKIGNEVSVEIPLCLSSFY